VVDSATTIQAGWRRWWQQRNYQQQQAASAVLSQAVVRKRQAQQQLAVKLAAVVQVQAHARGVLARRQLQQRLRLQPGGGSAR
jgi:hypothetical protein